MPRPGVPMSEEHKAKIRETQKRNKAEREALERARAAQAAAGPAEVSPEPPPIISKPAKAAPTPEAPPPNMFSGTTKRLEVFGLPGTDPNDPIPGFQLYWFDDVDNQYHINNALQSGWQFVTSDEVAMNPTLLSGSGNTDLGNYVRASVGGGVHAYLMKQPNWLHELNQTGPNSIEQRVHQHQEAQLRAGTLNESPNEKRYAAGRPADGFRAWLPAISMGRYYKPPS